MGTNNLISLCEYRERKNQLKPTPEPVQELQEPEGGLGIEHNSGKTNSLEKVVLVVSQHDLLTMAIPAINEQKGMLFLPYGRSKLLDMLDDEEFHKNIKLRFGSIVPTAPQDFPTYGNVPSEANPLFAYRREREILEYQIIVAELIMRNTECNTGIMLADEKYMPDITLIESRARSSGQFRTRFNSETGDSKALINQYIDDLLDKKISIPKITGFKQRKALSKQIQLLGRHPSKVIEQFPKYKSFMDACATYTEQMMISQMDGNYKHHSPICTDKKINTNH